jgi:hypothetical protein
MTTPTQDMPTPTMSGSSWYPRKSNLLPLGFAKCSLVNTDEITDIGVRHVRKSLIRNRKRIELFQILDSHATKSLFGLTGPMTFAGHLPSRFLEAPFKILAVEISRVGTDSEATEKPECHIE